MARARPFLQMAAVANFILLVVVYISYRAGVFDRPKAQAPRSDAAESVRRAYNAFTSEPQPPLLGGSKSKAVFQMGAISLTPADDRTEGGGAEPGNPKPADPAPTPSPTSQPAREGDHP
jgi:hypothetical protein